MEGFEMSEEESTYALGKLSEGFEVRFKDGVPIGYTNRTAYRSLSDENTITAVLDRYILSGKPIPDDVLAQLGRRAWRLQEIHDRRLLLHESLVSATRSGSPDAISEVQRELRDLDRDFYRVSVLPLSSIPAFDLKLGKWLVLIMASNGVPLFCTNKRPYAGLLSKEFFWDDSVLRIIHAFRRIGTSIPAHILAGLKWRAEALDEMYEFAERARKAGDVKLADDALELLKKCAGGDADETYAAFVKLRTSQKNPVAVVREADLGELNVREWHCELSRELRELASAPLSAETPKPVAEHPNPVATAREADLGELKDKAQAAQSRKAPETRPAPTRPERTVKNGGK